MEQDISPDPTRYDPIAAAYQEYADTNAYNALCERPRTVALLPPVSGRSVLNVACGPRFYAAWCAQRGATVCGFDSSPAMVALARSRLRGTASIALGSLRHLYHVYRRRRAMWSSVRWLSITSPASRCRCQSSAASCGRARVLHQTPYDRLSPPRVRSNTLRCMPSSVSFSIFSASEPGARAAPMIESLYKSTSSRGMSRADAALRERGECVWRRGAVARGLTHPTATRLPSRPLSPRMACPGLGLPRR